jgi:hypothetical protein
MTKIDEVPKLVRELYSIVHQLEGLFPSRRFTLDGHLVGSLGEVLAADKYDLQLLGASSEVHDARAPDGRLVQVKATQRRAVGLRAAPQHLVVLRLLTSGQAEEVYNGPGRQAWNKAGPMQKNGQRQISISMLSRLMDAVPSQERLPVVQR